MDNEISKNMSEELKQVNSFNFKQELQKKQYKTGEIMAPDIQLSKLQNMIRAQLMKNINGENKDTSTMRVIKEHSALCNENNVKNINARHSITTEILKYIKIEETEEINMEPILIKHEKEIANDNHLKNVNTDNNCFDRTKNSELNIKNIKTEPGIEKQEGASEMLDQENNGITDTAHGNIEYSFANIITMMAQIHGEECDVNMLRDMNLSCDEPKAVEKEHKDNIQPKLTKLVEDMRKKLQNKLNQAKPKANMNKQSSDTEKKCESVDGNMKRNIGLNAEHLLTSSEKKVKRTCKTTADVDKLYNCAVCKAKFINSSDFASHLLKCEINKPLLRSRHNMSRRVVEKYTHKCTRTRTTKGKI